MRTIVWIALTVCCAAQAGGVETTDLSGYFGDAAFIGRVIVREGRQSLYESNDAGALVSCGQVYDAEAMDQIFGEPKRKIRFASIHNFRIGYEYLVLLERNQQLRGLDVAHNESAKRSSCSDELPMLKEDWRFTSEFSDSSPGWVNVSDSIELPLGTPSVRYDVETIRIDGRVSELTEAEQYDLLPHTIALGGVVVEWDELRARLVQKIKLSSKSSSNDPGGEEGPDESGAP